MQGTTTLNS